MTYPECLDYLYNQLPVFHRDGSSALKKGLGNTLALCEAIGNPQHQFKSIHIAGTNGKGSSSNLLAAVLQSAGYKTGLYTSPHLKAFTERIRINGTELPEQYLVDWVQARKHLLETIQPSFFEMTVALAFQYFAEQQVDIAVIEVGMGGRLDSTNVIQPLVSLITNISLDHQQFLGPDLPSIAREKAGIIKAHTPVVVSQTQPEVSWVFSEVALEKKAPLFWADQEFKIKANKEKAGTQVLSVTNLNQPYLDKLQLGLGGDYQAFNAAGVLRVFEVLKEKGFPVSKENIREGFAKVAELTGFKGRWTILRQIPLTICDTGHNEAGIKLVVNQLNRLAARKVHFVFGMVRDKDLSRVLQILPPEYNYYFCQASQPRAMPATELQALAHSYNLRGPVFSNVNEALAAARQLAEPADVIFIGGSTFVVAEIAEL